MKKLLYVSFISLLTGCVVVPYDHNVPRQERHYEKHRPVVIYPEPRIVHPAPIYRRYPPRDVIVPTNPPPRVIVVPAPRQDRDRDRDWDRGDRPRPAKPVPPVLSPDIKEGPRMKIMPIKPGEEKDNR